MAFFIRSSKAAGLHGGDSLTGAADVGTFYGYPGGASRSDTGLEQSDTSLLFLYEDPQGRVSLVMIHDATDGSGGKAVFGFAGIASGTGFLVRDDPGDSSYLLPNPEARRRSLGSGTGSTPTAAPSRFA